MRLTLRTLLAYRDGVLATADHADLHRRIQQSPDAGNLLRRIQELTSGNQVLSPKLESLGLAGANVIAEYLDDVLTSTRVAELERLFLEYSEHLCELAHCHRMLAEAMHTQVDVPDELQRKAVELIDPTKRSAIKSQLLTQSRKLSKQVLVAEVVEPSPTNQTGLQASSAIPTNAASSQEAHGNLLANPVVASSRSIQQVGLNLEGASLSNEVPEYLLGSRKRRWQIPAAILALTAILFLLVWQSIGSLEDLQALMFATNGSDKVSSEGDGSTLANRAGKASRDQVAASPSSKKQNAKSQEGNSSNPEPANPTDSMSPEKSEDKSSRGNTARPAEPESADAVGGSESKSPPVKEVAAAELEKPAEKITDTAQLANVATGWEWKPADASESQSVVVFDSGDSISLIEAVDRPIANATIICPPVSRATFKGGDFSWQVIGPSTVELGIQQSRYSMKTSLCRAIVSSASPEQVFELITPAGNYEVQLLDKAAWLGIEVNYRAVARGSVVEPNTYVPVIVIVVATEGVPSQPELLRVESLADQQVIKVDSAGRGVAIQKAGTMESFTLQSPPTWYRKRSVRPIDLLGMADFHTAMVASSEPMKQRLRVLSTDPRPEVAALALQTSLLLGDWQPWASQLLSTDQMRSHWNSSIELARQSLAANPDRIKDLKTELQTKFGADADMILSLLVGLPQSDQTIDGLAGLIKGLDSSVVLPIRVLTAYQLRLLTGEDFSYQPHAPLRASLQQWRTRLAGGKIPLLPVNDPILERYPK